MFDLDAYLDRIRYSGARLPTVETLAAIHLHHAQAIPFENLNPLLGRPVPLDIDSLQRKMVRDGRGGYCYEQNILFTHALRTLGFDVTGLSGRVLWNRPEGSAMPRTHMVLLVGVGGQRYIADVGFGGLSLTSPLVFQAGLEQQTPHERFRLATADRGFVVEAFVAAGWKPLYRFDLEPQAHVDYEVGNWYVSTNPQSLFVQTLIAARPDPGRRYALRDRELMTHHIGGASERQVLERSADIRAALQDLFRIALPAGPELDVALERLPAATRA
jgi:N-hydroxyarylamine O-acetyltransferase